VTNSLQTLLTTSQKQYAKETKLKNGRYNMSGLPKRYARMGFAKGWKAFRASQSSGTPRRSAKVSSMAKRKRSFRGFARKAARRGGVGNSAALFQLDAMLYGAVRQKASDMIAPVTSKIPLGGISDEIGMGLLCWGVSKYAGKGMLGAVARKGLVIENARVGEAIAQQGLSLVSNNSTSNNSFIY